MKTRQKLALNGGKPILKKPFPPPYNIGKKEISAVLRLMKKSPLSGFIGAAGEYFLGGREVKKLEKLFCSKFGVKYAVAFNSATTALQAAVAALDIGPGDEVITSPYTMSASATSILMNGAVPIFADIEEKIFCLDSTSVEQKITKRTKAIMAVNLFGGPADFDSLLEIARKYKIKIIEDNAQAPGGKYKNKYAGTIGDIGVFSLNVHKVIQCGEGGILVTNNPDYAFRAQLVRNHGEAVIDGMPDYNLGPLIGSNYRMTELQAAIAYEQVLKLDFLNQKRIELANYLTEKLKDIPGVETPYLLPQTKHVYYVYPLKINENKFGISRDRFIDAMIVEGFPMSKGYVKPLYLQPLYQTRKVFNETHFPFKSNYYKGNPDYSKGSCPVAERMYEREFTFTTVCQYPYTKKHLDLFLKAVEKVLKNKKELNENEKNYF